MTLSHRSALFALRTMRERAAGDNTDLRHEATHVALARSEPWVGERWNKRTFDDPAWHWPKPTPARPLDVLVPAKEDVFRLQVARVHLCSSDLPASSIWWVDDITSIVCPELLFVQAANDLPLFYTVLLGYELCGNYSRCAGNPINGPVAMHVPPVTSVGEIRDYLDTLRNYRGRRAALRAVDYVADNAISPPEALLATIYSLPKEEYGYGMGPVELNKSMRVSDARNPSTERRRYPDLLFTFAPLGINYDGEDHLNLKGITDSTKRVALASGEDRLDATLHLAKTTQEVRSKYVDDMRRNRELLTGGTLVLPMVKEDLYERGRLDNFTEQLLMCARRLYGVDTSKYEKALSTSELCSERSALLRRVAPGFAGNQGRDDRRLNRWL